MGFTALDGLVMGTRCGALDPGALLYLLQSRGMNAADISDLLYKRSGLLGVSGLSADMRTLLASADPAAAEAIGSFRCIAPKLPRRSAVPARARRAGVHRRHR